MVDKSVDEMVKGRINNGEKEVDVKWNAKGKERGKKQGGGREKGGEGREKNKENRRGGECTWPGLGSNLGPCSQALA